MEELPSGLIYTLEGMCPEEVTLCLHEVGRQTTSRQRGEVAQRRGEGGHRALLEEGISHRLTPVTASLFDFPVEVRGQQKVLQLGRLKRCH